MQHYDISSNQADSEYLDKTSGIDPVWGCIRLPCSLCFPRQGPELSEAHYIDSQSMDYA